MVAVGEKNTPEEYLTKDGIANTAMRGIVVVSL